MEREYVRGATLQTPGSVEKEGQSWDSPAAPVQPMQGHRDAEMLLQPEEEVGA